MITVKGGATRETESCFFRPPLRFVSPVCYLASVSVDFPKQRPLLIDPIQARAVNLATRPAHRSAPCCNMHCVEDIRQICRFVLWTVPSIACLLLRSGTSTALPPVRLYYPNTRPHLRPHNPLPAVFFIANVENFWGNSQRNGERAANFVEKLQTHI